MASNPILRALQVLSPLGSPSEGPIETNYGKRGNRNVRDFPLFETSKHPKEDLEERGIIKKEVGEKHQPRLKTYSSTELSYFIFHNIRLR